MEKRQIFKITLGDLRGLRECGYLSQKGLGFLVSMENEEPTCDWCGNELNKKHDDEMCKYVNR